MCVFVKEGRVLSSLWIRSMVETVSESGKGVNKYVQELL